MHVPFRTARLALVLPVIAAIAGCGSSGSSSSNSTASAGAPDNGVASKSPEQIVAAATEALKGAHSLHVVGTTSSSGMPVKLNLTVVAGKGGTGEITQNGLSFRIITTGGNVYINGSDEFWRHFGGNAAVQLFHGKWLKAPATGELGSIAELTNLQQLGTKLLVTHGKLAKGETTTRDGQKVIAVKDTTQGGTLYVATTGKPYPIELSKTGSEGGDLMIEHYNEPATVTAPANSVDISQLH